MAKKISKYFYATGRRKESSARVFLVPGKGAISVNGISIDDYFGVDTIWKDHSLKPLAVLRQEGMFDIKATVKGGGISGQAGAISLGIARALDFYAEKNKPETIITEESEEEGISGDTEVLGLEKWHKAIRKAGLLTRDARRVLRKTVGLVKARKAKQFSKR